MWDIYSYHSINKNQQKLLGNNSNGFCNFARESGPVNLVKGRCEIKYGKDKIVFQNFLHNNVVLNCS